MTEEMDFSGTWKGFFVYGEKYGEMRRGKRVGFELRLEVVDGILTGTSVDEETFDLMDRPVTVDGFIEGRMISFIKRYPYAYRNTSEGTVVIDRSRPHHEIHYTGDYDPAGQRFEGTWEMEVIVQKDLFRDKARMHRGKWEMQKTN